MSALELARLQFGITTLFHFIFVPLSIGLAFFVATLQTAHHRTGKPVYGRMTRFWGKLMLISFAVGVVTGIVQEFQFGMNWSDYSRYVGDVFGAPLAIEALAAFFLESTFIGLWIFGRDRLLAARAPRHDLAGRRSAPRCRPTSSWPRTRGCSTRSATRSPTGRAEMTSIWAVLTNSTALYAFAHTMLGALATAGMVILGVSAYHLLRGNDVEGFRRSATLALAVRLRRRPGDGDRGPLPGPADDDPAADEDGRRRGALRERRRARRSRLFAVAPFEATPERLTFNIEVPKGLSMLSTNTPDGRVEGINDLQAEYVAKYGPGDYRPGDRHHLLVLPADGRHAGC